MRDRSAAGAPGDETVYDPRTRVVSAARAVLAKLNPQVPWSAEAVELHDALNDLARWPMACPVCGEALSPGQEVHARCRAERRDA